MAYSLCPLSFTVTIANRRHFLEPVYAEEGGQRFPPNDQIKQEFEEMWLAGFHSWPGSFLRQLLRLKYSVCSEENTCRFGVTGT